MAIIVCSKCGYHGPAIIRPKGNVLFELLLWMCFILPGLVYTLWRFFVRFPVCPKCKTFDVLPESSPMGKKLLRELAE
jgi:hypothetical protein